MRKKTICIVRKFIFSILASKFKLWIYLLVCLERWIKKRCLFTNVRWQVIWSGQYQMPSAVCWRRFWLVNGLVSRLQFCWKKQHDCAHTADKMAKSSVTPEEVPKLCSEPDPSTKVCGTNNLNIKNGKSVLYLLGPLSIIHCPFIKCLTE